MKKILIVLLLLLGRATFTIAQIPPYIPANGLVAWYPFNGNANDESGNGNNGMVNSVTLTADRFGNTNSAYEFNGVSSYISVPGNNSLHNIIDSMSCSIWIFAPPFAPVTEVAISKAQSGSQYGFSNTIYNNTNQCEFRVVNGNGLGGVYTTVPIITSSWHNIVSVVSATTRQIYCDGVLNTSAPAAGYFYGLNTAPLMIGCHLSLTNWFLGKIDDIGIWNRPLTAQEVTQIYNSSVGLEKIPVSNSFLLLPNPSPGNFIIAFEKTIGKGNIEIFNTLGECVFTEDISNESGKQINLKNIPQGIYFVNVSDGEKYHSQKIVIGKD
jgi:hypothetical protein